MTFKRMFFAVLVLALVGGGVVGWINYRRLRADYDAYQTLIQPGVKVAGVDVGWKTAEEARQLVTEQVAEPYYRDFTLFYQGDALALSPRDDLSFEIPVDEMVDEAVSSSHQYDYWEGFKQWLQGEPISLDLDVPLQMDFDRSAASFFLAGVAETHDIAPAEPMIDVQNLTFIPGRSGRRLDIEASAEMIDQRVPDPAEREVTLQVSVMEPDQSPARIRSMLSTLGPVMERPPSPPAFYTATVPLSTTGGLAGTPTVSYTGQLTWTFPYFANYTGPLTSTTGFFFEPGKPGYTFNITQAISQVDLALRAGVARPITFEPELVPAPPITPSLLLPPLKARLAEFPGVSSILIKNLSSGELIYNSNSDYVLSGMSISKIGIMVEVYRYYEGKVDEETHQELLDMLGSQSCNPCANRLLATVGGGSAVAGARKVTDTMRRLGLSNFLLCSPFRLEARRQEQGGGQLVWAANRLSAPTAGLGLAQGPTPRFDSCVKATPREMADLVEMIYDGTKGRGLLPGAYPSIFSPQICQDMIDIMASNDLRNMLGSGIPDDVVLAHKHGFSGYDVPWGDTRGEVGIIFSPGATWLISFYIWEDTPWIDWGINQPLYRDVSNMLYNYFNPDEPFWPLPPWAPEPEEDTGDSQS